MAQKTIERQLGSVDYEPGTTQQIELPRSHYFERLNLVFDWSITVNTTGGNSIDYGVEELVQNIRVVLNGNQTLKSVSFPMSQIIDTYQYGTAGLESAVDYGTASPQGGTSQTFVDFTIAPGDYSALLPAFQTSDLVLEITWGTADDITDSPGDITVDGASVTVNSKERIRKHVAKPGSAKEKKVLENLLAFKEREIAKTVEKQGENQVQLPRGNIYYATPLAVLEGKSPSNQVFSEYELVEDGVSTHKNNEFTKEQIQDVRAYGIGAPENGFIYPAFGTDADLTDVVDTSQIDQWELLLEADETPQTPTEVRVVTQEIID